MLLFRLLSEKNSVNVPSLKDNDFGLLKIMSTHINNDYFKQVKAMIPSTKYTNIMEFIDEFKKIMRQHYEAYLLFKGVPDALVPPKHHDKDKPSSKHADLDTERRKSTPYTSNKGGYYNRTGRPNSTYPSKPLYNTKIREDYESDNSWDDGDTKRYESERYDSRDSDQSEEDSINSRQLWRNVETESSFENFTKEDEDSIGSER